MPLRQNIQPYNPDLADLFLNTSEMDWIPDIPEKAFFKLLWTCGEKNGFAVLFRWLKGFTAPPHKHLGSSHTFILKGKLQLRDRELNAGDYMYERNGMIHGATTALEDTEYLFIQEGPLVFFNEDHFLGYLSWEDMQRKADAYFAAKEQGAGSSR